MPSAGGRRSTRQIIACCMLYCGCSASGSSREAESLRGSDCKRCMPWHTVTAGPGTAHAAAAGRGFALGPTSLRLAIDTVSMISSLHNAYVTF